MNFLSDNEKWQFALFLKRITFNDALEKTTGGNDKNEAYFFLEVIDKVQGELAALGFAPR